MIEAGKTYPLRGGLTARIGFTDKKGVRPISGLVDVGERELHQTWFADGRAWDCGASDYDIVMPEPEILTVWENWYGGDDHKLSPDTRKDADERASAGRTHVIEFRVRNGEPVDVKIHKVER